MSGFFLTLWIALIGADRIDLAGGHGPFIVTPFLALTPIVIGAELARRSLSPRPVTITRGAMFYLLFATLLVGATLLSVFQAAASGVSAARAVLLAAQVFGTLSVAVLASDRPDLVTIFARGGIICLVLYGVFDVSETLWWIGRGPEVYRLGPITAHFDSLQNAGILPRLAGPVADANRGGFVLLFYAFAIGHSRLSTGARRAGMSFSVLFIALTMSRSTAMGAIATLGVAMLLGMRAITPRTILAGMIAVSAAAVLVMVSPGVARRFEAIEQTGALKRFSSNEGSARGHLALIERGTATAMESIPSAAWGVGYGNAYLTLRDIFPGNKYGNFHSLYVNMFAEAGIIALLLTLILTGVPLFTGEIWRPLVAGTIAFNLFYQTPAEPVFWLLLALAWGSWKLNDRMAMSTARS